MAHYDANAEKDAVSIGTIVAAPDGSEWVVIDPKRLDDDLPTEEFYWLGAVSADCESDSRGCGKETFEVEDWEVVN
jgi:hypothetical protein